MRGFELWQRTSFPGSAAPCHITSKASRSFFVIVLSFVIEQNPASCSKASRHTDLRKEDQWSSEPGFNEACNKWQRKEILFHTYTQSKPARARGSCKIFKTIHWNILPQNSMSCGKWQWESKYWKKQCFKLFALYWKNWNINHHFASTHTTKNIFSICFCLRDDFTTLLLFYVSTSNTPKINS